MRLDVLHGPNLNLLGSREPEVYGTATLAEIDDRLRELAGALDVQLETYQSNHEGELIDRVQSTADETAGYVVNAGGYTHTSVALRDALMASGRPFVEVHISNIHGREAFRRTSLLADAALATVSGFGADSYGLALRGLARHLKETKQE